MIASPRRHALSLPVTRRFEFTRLQKKIIASAYEALLPVIARRPAAVHNRPSDCPKAATRADVVRSSGAGA
jgi:hypothetical protein